MSSPTPPPLQNWQSCSLNSPYLYLDMANQIDLFQLHGNTGHYTTQGWRTYQVDFSYVVPCGLFSCGDFVCTDYYLCATPLPPFGLMDAGFESCAPVLLHQWYLPSTACSQFFYSLPSLCQLIQLHNDNFSPLSNQFSHESSSPGLQERRAYPSPGFEPARPDMQQGVFAAQETSQVSAPIKKPFSSSSPMVSSFNCCQFTTSIAESPNTATSMIIHLRSSSLSSYPAHHNSQQHTQSDHHMQQGATPFESSFTGNMAPPVMQVAPLYSMTTCDVAD